MTDLISVIVPVYNVAADLPRCLDSILAQTYPHIEIIAVDDGSPDNSGEILDRYAEKYANIRVTHKENGGVTSARLRGVQEAAGVWIGFVDSDDEIEPDMYERLMANAQKYGADISHCGYRMVFEDGRVSYFHNTGTLEKHDCVQGIRELLSGERIEPGLCNKLFRKDLFQDWEMDESIRINEDLLMNYYLFSKAEVSIFDDWCPYHYIVRSASASRAKMNAYKIYDPIRVKEIILQAAPADIQTDARRAYINTCINTYHALLVAGAGYRDDLQKIRNLLEQEKTGFSALDTKRALMARLILYAPLLYRPVYRFYCRFLQNDPYS